MQADMTRILTIPLTCLLVAGCTAGLRMQPPGDLAGTSKVLEVANRSRVGGGLLTREDFDLGPYHVRNIDRAWNRVRNKARNLWFIKGRKLEGSSSGGFSFSFDTGTVPLAGICETVVLGKHYKFGNWSVGENEQSMRCQCRKGDAVVSSLLVADTGVGMKWGGTMALGETVYRLETQRRLEGNRTNAGPAGYRFDGSSPPPLGAIDITHPGRVWLHNDLSGRDREGVACVATAILLEPKPSDASEFFPEEPHDSGLIPELSQ